MLIVIRDHTYIIGKKWLSNANPTENQEWTKEVMPAPLVAPVVLTLLQTRS
jgi:hypothetical protein